VQARARGLPAPWRQSSCHWRVTPTEAGRNPITAYYYPTHPLAAFQPERTPDEPREPFSPLTNPFAPTVTTGGTASMSFHGPFPDAYGS
jgi:hypothetical protein